MDADILSRIQFGVTAGFHYIYPPMSIGLGILLVVMELIWLRTGDPLWGKITRFWVAIFGLTFGMGVATGIVMEFQFGTNWARYSEMVGDVFGSALAAEGVFAFFLESGFLAILVFGWDRVNKFWHFFSTCMVSLGSMFSAVWIVVANSWQQTPAGYKLVERTLPDGSVVQRAEITGFWDMVFNPSSIDRLTHVVMGAFITGAFLVISVSAYYLIKQVHLDAAKRSMKVGLSMALVTCLVQIWLGHDSTMGVAANQPEKFAAIEGAYRSDEPIDLTLIGMPDEANQRISGITLPGAGSMLLGGSADKTLGEFTDREGRPLRGLSEYPADELPPVPPVFASFHLMVAIGMAMTLISVLGGVLWWRDKLWNAKWLLRIMVVAVVLPHAANMLGWMTAEIGRQPWSVYRLLRTSDSLSPAVNAAEVGTSLGMFAVIYTLLFALFIFLLDRKIKAGPGAVETSPLLEPEAAKADVIAKV